MLKAKRETIGHLLEPHLQVGQLPKGLAAHVTLVLDFAVLLLQRVWKCFVARRAYASFYFGQVDGLLVGVLLTGVARQG